MVHRTLVRLVRPKHDEIMLGRLPMVVVATTSMDTKPIPGRTRGRELGQFTRYVVKERCYTESALTRLKIDLSYLVPPVDLHRGRCLTTNSDLHIHIASVDPREDYDSTRLHLTKPVGALD